MRNQIPIGKRNLHAGNFVLLKQEEIRFLDQGEGALTVCRILMAPDLPLYS